MRIGLITDTHIPDVAKCIPPQVADVFEGVELILHAGDIYALSVLDELQEIAPVLAVLGDDDHSSLAKDERVKQKQVLDLAGHRIWLTHEGPWFDRIAVRQAGYTPDVIVHGHSHDARIRNVDGVMLVGSGSATFLNYNRGPGSVAILELGPDGPVANIIRL